MDADRLSRGVLAMQTEHLNESDNSMAGKHMFAVYSWLPDLSGMPDRLVLMALAKCAGLDDSATPDGSWHSVQSIGRQLGISRRAVQRSLRNLETLGLIESETAHNAKTPVYFLTEKALGGRQTDAGATQTPMPATSVTDAPGGAQQTRGGATQTPQGAPDRRPGGATQTPEAVNVNCELEAVKINSVSASDSDESSPATCVQQRAIRIIPRRIEKTEEQEIRRCPFRAKRIEKTETPVGENKHPLLTNFDAAAAAEQIRQIELASRNWTRG